ncbi:MAG: M48 family metallopeptidase [Verrucomicrobiota bacterium]|jgi:metalloendopeptidase OMA1, mitochondrial
MKRGRFHVVLLWGILGALLWFSSGCATVPVTGRKQLNLISPGQEMQLGLTSFEKMKQELPISRNAAANALVERVGKKIAAAASADLPNAQWEFVVFESQEANAFCLPGGKIGVYTGILPITRDEEGLATVLGHEVAHAAAHHGGERMSEALVMQTGGQFLGSALSSSSPQTQALLSTLYGLGAQLGRALPHSRQQELEADYIGLVYMKRAGYNPARAVDFWERFSQYTNQRGGPPWFLRTHPVSSVRIEKIREALPKVQAEPMGGAVIGRPRP